MGKKQINLRINNDLIDLLNSKPITIHNIYDEYCNVELCNAGYVTMALVLRIDLTNGNYPIPTSFFWEWL